MAKMQRDDETTDAQNHASERRTEESTTSAREEDLRPEIAERAYELYRSRGTGDGHDVDDWLQAEREIRDRSR